MSRRKKRQYMGRVAICTGLFLKILQILLGAQLQISFFSSVMITTVTTAILVGGFCVFAVERMNITAVFSLLCAVCVLLSVCVSGKAEISFVLLVISFISHSAMLISMKRIYRIYSGIAVIALCAFLICHNAGVIFLTPPVITLLLILLYSAEGIGLFL